MRLRKTRILKCLVIMAVTILVGPHLLKLLTDRISGENNDDDVINNELLFLPRDNIVADKVGDKKDTEKVSEVQSDQLGLAQKNLVRPVIFNLSKRALPKELNEAKAKIDWHNYEKIQEEKLRKGNGEQSMALILAEEDTKLKEDLYKMNGFNAYLSDKISIDRSIRDIRHAQCWNKTYLAHLPNVSIVIPFHNEHWSVLMRSVHSILNRSPAHLIHEIILVDDFSDREHLKQQLDDHLAKNYDGKVKVVRQSQREGLIRTRITGAKAATGQVLLFLDSHIEANVNWFPPLLEPIAEDYRTVTCPFIDVIDKDNFALRPQDQGARGAFDWMLFYKRLPLLPESLLNPTEPFESPVMAGGLFAISAKWFWELGGYDPGLDIWGGEQYELSFKLWMCGGRMVDTPCSRVGHIYRSFNPFGAVGKGDYVGRNHLRVAEVWMDEYKAHVLRHNPHMQSLDPGDLTEQKRLRTKLQCKSFDWFMKEVAFDLTRHYPPDPPPNTAYGEIRSVAAARLCIDTKFKVQMNSFGLDQCSSDQHRVPGEQQMELTWKKDIRPKGRTVCFDASEKVPRAPLILFACHSQMGNQWWKYNVDTHQLFHPATAQCLDCDTERKAIFMFPCNPNSLTQKWKWGHVNETIARNDWLQN